MGDIMTEDVKTTTPDEELVEAAQKMMRENIGCLLVIEDLLLCGIVTEADFLKLAWEMEVDWTGEILELEEKNLGVKVLIRTGSVAPTFSLYQLRFSSMYNYVVHCPLVLFFC